MLKYFRSPCPEWKSFFLFQLLPQVLCKLVKFLFQLLDGISFTVVLSCYTLVYVCESGAGLNHQNCFTYPFIF